MTGASGFLGRSIVERLRADGYRVRGLVRAGRILPWTDVETAHGDLADGAAIEAAVKDMEFVVHAGARVETTGKWEEFAEANIRGTKRVIRAAVAAGVKRIVHISSLSVYDVPRDGVTITEDSSYERETSARGHYSRSKLAADRLALWEADRGAPVIVLRPGLLYGPGKRPPVARQSFTRAGFKLLLARPRYRMPYSYVENVADAVALSLQAPGAIGKAFTLVDENVTQAELVAAYRAASREAWRPLYLPVGLIAAAAWFVERTFGLARRRSPITYHQIRRSTDSAWYDCSRAEQILGWHPRVDLKEGLRRAFDALSPAAPGLAVGVAS
ncbi:MAG: NAD-dependent epimerase/dehydratase family protein [Deltaproteobacteria bacterium]|nr:NAD-dependent epimerase/dehydratase family protein [Deltaproteobacteria bacterium]